MSRSKNAPGTAAGAATVRQAPNAAAPLSRHALWLVPALAAVIAYWRSFSNGFVWDDPLVLQQLRHIRGLGDLFVLPPDIPHLYYRPVVFASYLLDLALGGERPFWFHASVVAWHVANSVMVYFLARALLAPETRRTAPSSAPLLFASLAAVLFAIHPAHVESVAWMAGRSDVIACAFLLAAILWYLRNEAYAAWVGGAFFLLALLTKEPVALAILILPLASLSLGRPLRAVRLVPFALALGIYLAMRSAGAGLSGEPTQASGAPWLDVVRALGVYFAKAFLPLGQDVFFQNVPQSPLYLVLGAAGAVALGGLFVFGWRARSAAIVVSLAWFGSTIAPALLLVVRRIASNPVAERYVYIPSVGAVILLAWLFLRLATRTHRERLILGLGAVLALVGLVEVGRRNHVWSDEVVFWTVAAEASTDATAQREIADALLRRGRVDEAEAAYLAALQRPASVEERAMTYSNLGNLYSRGPRVDEAIKLFQNAIALRPHPTLYHGMGLAQMRRAEQAQARGDQQAVLQSVVNAEHAFEQAIALGSRPDAPSAFQQWDPSKTHLLLGQVLLALNKRDEAREQFELVLQLEPSGLAADTARKFLTQTGAPPQR